MTSDPPAPGVRCTYCGATENLTADHVPPKCLFPADRRQALVTVPACQTCNQGAAKDDEYFRFVVAAPASDHNEAARRIWDEGILPAVRRRPRMRAAILGTSRMLELRTPAGLYLGKTPGFRIDGPRVVRVVDRIIRGLFWHHFEAGPAADAEIKTYIDPDLSAPDMRPIVDMLTADLTLAGIGGDVFRYRYAQANDAPGYSMWWLYFYSWTTFLTIIVPSTERDRVGIRA